MSKLIRDGSVNVRVNKNMREMAEQILMTYGLTVGDCVNIMLSQIVRTKGVPFDMKPSVETQAAINLIRRTERTDETNELLDFSVSTNP